MVYPPTLFQCVRFFVSTEPEFPNIYQRLPKIYEDAGIFPKSAEDFPTTSEDNRRYRKISTTSKQANDFQRISNQSRAVLRSSEDVLTTFRTSKTTEFLFNRFLSNCTRYCHLDFETGPRFPKDFQPISSIIKEFRRCSDDFSNVKNN